MCRQQEAYGFPPDRLPPACSIAVAIDQGEKYEITRIGDTTAIVVTGERVTVLATDFFDRREGAAVHDQRNGDTAAQVRTAMMQRRLHTMTAGDIESVFSGHPRRQLRPHTVAGDWTGTDHVLLCTDGFARLVSDYALYPDWHQVITDGGDHGLAYLEKLIRDVERGPAGDAHARFKLLTEAGDEPTDPQRLENPVAEQRNRRCWWCRRRGGGQHRRRWWRVNRASPPVRLRGKWNGRSGLRVPPPAGRRGPTLLPAPR